MSPEYHFERIKSVLRQSSGWASIDSSIKGNRHNSPVTDAIVQEICCLNVSNTHEALRKEFAAKKNLLEQTKTPNPAYANPIKEFVIKTGIEEQVIALLAQKLEEPVLTEREKLILSMIQGGDQERIEDAQTYFTVENNERCPYCFQPVSDEYRQGLLESIRRVMNRAVDDHKSQLRSLVLEEIQDVFEQYSELDKHIVIDLQKAIRKYNDSMQQYRHAVQKKLQRVYTPVEQPKLCINDQLGQINLLIRQLEKKRAEFVAATQDRRRIEKELILINKQMAYYHCKDEYAAYKKQSREKDKATEKYQQQERMLQQVEAQLKQLLDQKKNLALAIECINESLA